MKKICTLVLFLAIVTIISGAWTKQKHEYSPGVSAQIAGAVKDKILANINGFANRQFADALKNDLNEGVDANRKLKEIDAVSLQQLFAIFNIRDPGCDQNGDMKVNGSELKCLNIIWKSFVPSDN